MRPGSVFTLRDPYRALRNIHCSLFLHSSLRLPATARDTALPRRDLIPEYCSVLCPGSSQRSGLWSWHFMASCISTERVCRALIRFCVLSARYYSPQRRSLWRWRGSEFDLHTQAAFNIVFMDLHTRVIKHQFIPKLGNISYVYMQFNHPLINKQCLCSLQPKTKVKPIWVKFVWISDNLHMGLFSVSESTCAFDSPCGEKNRGTLYSLCS